MQSSARSELSSGEDFSPRRGKDFEKMYTFINISYLLCLFAAEVRRVEGPDLNAPLVGRPQPGVFLRRPFALLLPGASVSQAGGDRIKLN